MATRIRDIRKQRGLTLQQLADQVGTTAQTIQRLETANMTMSLDWLIRIAGAMDLTAADLLDEHSGRRFRLLGSVGPDGTVVKSSSEHSNGRITVDLPQVDPIAVRLTEASGKFESGTLLIAETAKADELAIYQGKPCLVGRRDGKIDLRRLVIEVDGKVGLGAHAGNGQFEPDPDYVWIAPVRVAIRYL